ncbi:hypothetical protein D3C80_1000260 [compost metagenome]
MRLQAGDKRPAEECDAKNGPQTKAPYVTHHALQQEHRQRQDDETEGDFDCFHPRPAFRQQTVTKHGDQNQRQTHAQRVQIQRTAAQPHVPALRDVEQDRAQRRGGARRANQPGNRTHHKNTTCGSALLAIAHQR